MKPVYDAAMRILSNGQRSRGDVAARMPCYWSCKRARLTRDGRHLLKRGRSAG